MYKEIIEKGLSKEYIEHRSQYILESIEYIIDILKYYIHGKYDINENDKTFHKCAVADQNEIIRALSGKKYDTIENIKENHKLQTSPNTFLEFARAQYNGKNIKII